MMNVDTLSKHWEFFEKIYCISIDARTDRRNEAKSQFSNVGLLDRVEFVIVKKHLDNCEQGIYESHMTCIERGLQADAGNIVIFEDDVLFERLSPAKLKRCIDFLAAKPDWSVLFFGCLVAGSERTENESVLKVKYRSLAHAYALNRKFSEVLVQKPWQNIAFDAMLGSLKDKCYAIYPAIAFQSNSSTDNANKQRLDKFRRLLGGLMRIQKWNERYYRHRTIIIAVHVILILLISLWII
ncbi:glycosyltransferase [Thermodesulfobacteriota bacterium]